MSQNMMQYTRLGNSGLKISKVILGCMGFGDKRWQEWVIEEEEATKLIKAAYDSGINTFDTSNNYSHGVSEKILGKAIKQHNLPREEIVVMTKVNSPILPTERLGWMDNITLYMIPPEKRDEMRLANQYGLSRKHIFDSVKNSLARLGLDYIDVLQCHRFDYNTPIEETMHALHDVVKAGWVRYIGISSCWAWQFQKMQNYAIRNGLTPFISMQNLHNAAYREEEREMIPMLRDMGVGIIPWSPNAMGFLTRPVEESFTTARGQHPMFRSGFDINKDPSLKVINERIQAIAAQRGVTMAQVSIAWSLTKVDAPIVGLTSVQRIDEAVAAVNFKLTSEEIKSIEEPYVPKAIFGHV